MVGSWSVSRKQRHRFRDGLRGSETIPLILLASFRGRCGERRRLTKDELLSRFLQMEEKINELEEKPGQRDRQIEE